ncbi:MAG: YvcK family protein [bacterium]|nr:YvcK family protein [bacterium]
MKSKSDKKIVVIGGGTGVFTVLSGLKHYFNNLTAVVTMADDGGSTGVLREEFGILPPGDIRRALIALSSSDNKILSDLFGYRFQEGAGLSGHSFGNLMITALQRITGSFDKAVDEVSRILAVQGQVIPVTLEKTRLIAELADGQVIKGENNIDIPQHDGNIKISKIRLSPAAPINPKAKKAIMSADGIVIGPGDLYTSLIPNLLVRGVKEALAKTKGKVIYFVNTMTKFGETNGFQAHDFVNELEQYLGKKVIDYVVVNKTRPSTMRFKPYVQERSEFVDINPEKLQGAYTAITSNLIRKYGLIRHDSDKVARMVQLLI